MIIRPTISAPLPWLTILLGRFYPGASSGSESLKNKKHLFPRTLKITKLGKWYIAILLLIGIAAINTGNNLLYLVVGMLLSLIIISGLMSESTLRGLSVTRRLPARVFSGIEVLSQIDITNSKRLFPSFSFVVSELNMALIESSDAYVLKLARGESIKRQNTIIFKERGEINLEGLLITTSFPFSLFRKGKREQAGEKRLVYPRLRPLTGKEKQEMDTLIGKRTGGNTTVPRKGDGAELHSLNEYRPGDDSRNIDWKSSAKSRKLLSKEYERDEEHRVMIDFDNCAGKEEYFEHCVTKAASLACHLIDRGYQVALKTKEDTTGYKRGRAHLYRILDTLALIEPNKNRGSSKRPSVKVRGKLKSKAIITAITYVMAAMGLLSASLVTEIGPVFLILAAAFTVLSLVIKAAQRD